MNIRVKSKNQINGIMANPNYNYSKLSMHLKVGEIIMQCLNWKQQFKKNL